MPPLLDPTLDVVFALLFAGAKNRDLLIALLTAVLQPRTPIGNVTVLNPDLPKQLVSERGAVLDVLVRLEDGRQVNVEMQSRYQSGLPQRILYYWAGMFRAQLGTGTDFTDLTPCVSILIGKRRELPGERYHSTFRILEVHEHSVFAPELELHTLELPKLPERAPGHREEAVVQWGRFLAAKTEQKLEELAMTDPVFQKAKDALELLSADPEAQELARRRELALWETRRQEAFARKEGEEYGRAEGRAEGRTEGRTEGRAEGLRQAVHTACELLGIEVDALRRTAIDSLDADGLERLLTALRQNRCWPSE